MTEPKFHQFAPSPALAPYVECYWMLDLPPKAPLPVLTIPADGRVELMFNFAAGSQRSPADGGIGDICDVRSASYLMGARGQGYALAHHGAPSYVAVRFRAGGLGAFTRLPLAEVTDLYVELDCLWPATIVRRIEQQLAEAISPAHQAAILESALLQQLYQPDHLTRLAHAARLLEQGRQPIPAVAESINLSQKHFERLFARYVGFRPSMYARVARFQRTLYGALIRPRSLSQLAQDGGYYDQAHFSKEFRAFTGSTPNEFFAQQHDFVRITAPRQVVEFLQDLPA